MGIQILQEMQIDQTELDGDRFSAVEKKIPVEAEHFEASYEIDVTCDGQSTTRAVKIHAYDGGVFNHGWWGPVAFDLQSVKKKAKIPILRQHDPLKPIGYANKFAFEGGIDIEGKLTQKTRDGREIIDAMDDSIPFEASIGMNLRGAQISEIPEGTSMDINGKVAKGPFTFFKNATLKEVSIVPFGSDSKTKSMLGSEVEKGEHLTVEVRTVTTNSQGDLQMGEKENALQHEKGKQEQINAEEITKSAIEQEKARVTLILKECGNDTELAAKLINSNVSGADLYKELHAAEKAKNEKIRSDLKAANDTKGVASDQDVKKNIEAEKKMPKFNTTKEEDQYLWGQMDETERNKQYLGEFEVFHAAQEAIREGRVKFRSMPTADLLKTVQAT